ncbi:endolytic transglycosylase MltG [Streptomyces sp. NPDC079020]|uniref:endolytic transglycosylase MltG n=1 Tax=Streptomyces sp. NPDC079020 TaxID=3365722 RepID=UPI0037CEC345
MTEYGRGPGSEPWHPEDPLYGGQGWGGQEAAHGQSQYGGQQQPYPQDPYAQQQPHQPYQQQQPYQQHPEQQQQPYQQHPEQQQPQQHQQYAAQQDPYAQQPHQPQAPQQPQHQQQPQYNGGWDTGQQAAMPYGAQPQDPYQQQPGGYGESQDYYGTPEAYPPPQPPGRREAVPEQQQSPDWDPDAPQEETHPFFTGEDEPGARDGREASDDRGSRDGRGSGDDDDEYEDDPRESRRAGGRGGRGGSERRGKGKKKNRSGCACLVVSAVLIGGLGGVGYVGYSFWQKQFGEAPDFAGSGSGSVEVEIPKGALGYDIANILKKKGVIKSVDAFVSAQNGNPKGKSIQAGVYLLKNEMSASSALELMLDPKSQNALVIPEGTRNARVYEMIDERLGLKEGSTADVAKTKAESLGLPDWVDDDPDIKDPLEGFLFPAAYPVAKGTKPEDALKRMVKRANEEYEELDLEGAAKKYKLDDPWQVLTVASMVQAEGLTHEDFRKMAEVVYNRLEPGNVVSNGKIEFDSAFNYLKKQSKIKITSKEIRTNPDPYNTYYHAGLPPGPISNPGDEALRATLSPTSNGWMFFISLDGKKTQFTKTAAEHEKLNDKFKELHGLG